MSVNYCLFHNLSKSFTCQKSTLLGIRNLNLSAYLTNKAVIRSGKNFNKLLGHSSKKKKFYVGSFVAETPVLPGEGAKKVRGGKESSRRITVLNKLFMTHITDLMATGNAANYICGLNIEISRVSMCTTFTQLNVYWLAEGSENDKLVESRLMDISASLRHELSQLRVMGEVPRIVFCKDKHYAKVNEVEEILKKADFGDGYIPVSIGNRFKEDNTTIYSEEEREQPEEELPEMSQNTLNLRHDYILNKIQKCLEKSKALHRQFPDSIPANPGIETTSPSFMTVKERKEGLQNFLLQRRILHEKNIKQQRRFVPEVILNDNEGDSSANLIQDDFDKFNKDLDYLEEEEN